MKGKTFAVALTILLIGLSTILTISPDAKEDNNPFLDQSINPNKYILFTPEYSKDTHLINGTGEIVQTWHSNYLQGLAVYLLDNGDIIRSDSTGKNLSFTAGGFTGHIEKFNWNGTRIWEFEYSTDTYCLHHDIEPLPNGNILMIAWEKKNETEVLAAGGKPYPLGNNILWPDHIIEVEPHNDTFGGTIVWEWHVWDHLIQDYDATKANFGNVSQHPELIDINYRPLGRGGRSDFNHINSIDYQEEYDQILLSVSEFSEIWIIDHSTTTLEAASHTGGNSGKGGDILYRWGNPQAYQTGTPYDQKLFEQHDARWIETGCPGEGHILVYNNGLGRPAGRYSSVDEIIPPVDNNGSYFHAPDSPYGPENPTWIYTADNPTTLFSKFLSGAQRLPNGNTLICDGPHGFFFEVTPDKEIIWEYLNPFPSSPIGNQVFKMQCYYLSLFEPDLTCNHTLKWLKRTPGETIRDTFSFQNSGGFDSSLDWKIESWPDWGHWTFTPTSGKNLTREEGIFNVDIKLVVPTNGTNPFTGNITIVNQDNPDDSALIPVHLTLDLVPHLWCNGSLNWTNVIPGDIVLSNISIKNIGAPGSLLNWKIESWPDWGHWNFLPNTGENLTTDEPLNLTVFVTAPLIADKEFTGHIKLINIENTTNYHLLNTSLATSHNPNNIPPIADFHWMPPDTLNTHEQITFIDDSSDTDGTLIAWQWDFDDGTTAHEQHPLHTYNSIGTYTITLTVSDNNGSQSSKTKQLTITNLSPQADAGLDQIINTTHAILDGTRSQDPDGDITLYTWYFGDGTNTTGSRVTHTYPMDGVYIATLIVTDNNGATHSDTCTITIDTIPPQTTALINGTTGERHWYTSTVTIHLHYTDTLPGIHDTYYQTNSDEWKPYQEPCTFTSEGIHTLSFYSIDRAGNREERQNMTIKIDKTPPHVLITSPKKGYLHIFGRTTIPTWRERTLIIGGIMIETTITSYPSGIYNVTFYVNDILKYSTSQPPYTWNWEQGYGRSTLKVVCFDNAGHSQSNEINVIMFSIH